MPSFDQLIRMTIVHRVPGMEDVEIRRDLTYATADGTPLGMDVYRPAEAGGTRLPAVVLIHGGPIPVVGAKRMGVFTSYGRLLAASGFVAVTFNHRFLAPERLLDAAADVEAATSYVRGQAGELGVDENRLAFWAFSGGGPLLSLALRGAPSYVRALVAYYAALELIDETRRDLSPIHHLRAEAGRVPPILVARAGLDQPSLNAGIDRFVQEALATNACVDVLNHPAGRHGFDILDDDARSREIIARTVEFLRLRLA
ncbi:MAG TPA: alpha/beta hydrolase [Thermoanaerobaculia bacterium]|nr:alpha/beta hydrolase [Thermoanaerobaculia bacterium]